MRDERLNRGSVAWVLVAAGLAGGGAWGVGCLGREPETGGEGADEGARTGGQGVVGMGCQVDADCEDGSACSVDYCLGNYCKQHRAPDGTACDDGSACTAVDECHSGVCEGSGEVPCDVDGVCALVAMCNPATGGCETIVAAPDGEPCNDGNGCTLVDGCLAGVCVGTGRIVCAAADECHAAGECDPATGLCGSEAANEGEGCDDQDPCTKGDFCRGGECVGGETVGCPPPDSCHLAGTCDPATGECSNPVIEGCMADTMVP